MTAIVTGRKTNNGVLAQGPDAIRKRTDGAPLQSILEYAEARGLSTGIVTNDSVAGATPAALYAKANDRGKDGGDHPPGVLAAPGRWGRRPDRRRSHGPGRRRSRNQARTSRLVAGAAHRTLLDRRLRDPARRAPRGRALRRRGVRSGGGRPHGADGAGPEPARLLPDGRVRRPHRPRAARARADGRLRSDHPRHDGAAGPDTLVLFTADHSFDLRVHDGATGSQPARRPGRA